MDTDALTALLHKLRGELDLRPAHRRAEEDGGADIPRAHLPQLFAGPAQRRL